LELCSLSLRRPREGSPKRLSRLAPRPLAPGGGGKARAPGGSGEGRCTAVVVIRGGGVDETVCSKAVLIGRCCWLLGGLYGGGGAAGVTGTSAYRQGQDNVEVLP